MSTQSQGVQIFGVVGSPRKKGNTGDLIEAVLKGARSVGAQSHKLYISDLEINPCSACDYCRTQGKCFHKDDMSIVKQHMRDSKVWVFGTPVYWWGPTAQIKALVDRWYGCVDELQAMKDKKVILAVTFGDDTIETAKHTVGMFEDSFKYLHKEIFEILIAPSVSDPGDIKKSDILLEKAFNAGRQAVLS